MFKVSHLDSISVIAALALINEYFIKRKIIHFIVWCYALSKELLFGHKSFTISLIEIIDYLKIAFIRKPIQ